MKMSSALHRISLNFAQLMIRQPWNFCGCFVIHTTNKSHPKKAPLAEAFFYSFSLSDFWHKRIRLPAHPTAAESLL